MALNTIPHVKVKSIGFFALRGITIQTSSQTIKLKKISLRMNLLRGKSSPLKLFNLGLYGVEIEIRHMKGASDKKPSTNGGAIPDIQELLSIVLPKGFYDLLFYYQILNQFHVMIYNFTMYHEKLDRNSKFYFDYAKIENALRYDGHNSLTLLLFNGFLHELEDHERIQLFRNVEVILSCDAVFNCLVSDKNKIQADLMNFGLTISLGKAHVPLDHLHVSKKSEEAVEAPKKCHPISKDQLKQIKSIWRIFNEFKITLEDFTLSLGPCVLKIATFQTSLDHIISRELEYTSAAKIALNITDLKVYEAETKCFALPAGSIVFEANPFALLQGIENSHHSELISNVTQLLDLSLDITLTNPSIDLYHDQILYFEIKKATRTQRVRNEHINVMNILLALRNVSTKLVIIGTLVDAHIPPLGEKEFHRDSSLNISTKYSFDSITQKFATKNLAKSILEQGKVKQQLYGLFKIKNFKAEFLDNILYVSKTNLLTTYNIKQQDVSLKLNVKHIKIKSINSAIFQLVREVRSRRIRLDNEVYSLMVCNKNPVEFKGKEETTEKYIELFTVLPKVINRLKLEVNEVQADIICKDGLPLQIYTDPETNETFDLKDFARGLSVKLGQASLSYKRGEEEISASVRSLNCFTLSEFDLDYLYDFDVVALYSKNNDDFSDISSIESIVLAEEEKEESLKQVKKVLDIEEIEINNMLNKQRDKNRLYVRVPEVSGRLDIFLVWCSIYAASLLKTFAPTEERLCSKKEIKSLMGEKDKILKMDISIPVISVVTRFPNRVDVLAEFDSLTIRNVFESRTFEFAYFRGFIVHPITKLWARFLTFKNSFLALNATVDNGKMLELVCKGIRLNIPHGFLFYTVIDNAVTFGKAIQQIKHNFGNFLEGNMDFKALPQNSRGPLNMPTINIKSDLFALTLESDPFENELAFILELGLVEQKTRIKKYAAFDKKVEEILENTVEQKIKLTDTSVPKTNGNASHPSFFNAFKHNHGAKSSTGKDNNLGLSDSIESSMLLSEEEAKNKIDHARDLLEEEIAKSWIMKFKRFRSVKIKNWRTKSEAVWGKEKISDQITEKFDIMNYLPGPLLLGLVFRQLDLTVSKSTVPDLDKFLYDYGKGQPKLDYSILAPLHLDIKSAAVFSFLKDYSIPLISFPYSDVPGKPAFHLSGNIVINEKLVHREEEMRKIWVPFSPPMAPDLDSDSFYYVTARRTLTPIKFMVDLNCKIDSERAAMISWCKSYQAALLAAMSAVDSFTKPKIDDSPIGWWDKIALLLHGQMTFDIPNELCFHMKSSTNPYDLTGRNAGFVFCWKNNVILNIDGMRSSKELITLHSDDFLLAIPNYSIAEKKSWSLFYEEMSDDVTDEDSEAKKYLKKVMSLTSDEKVQWTLGLLFERNQNNSTLLSDKEKRTDKFLPHYDVVVTSPLYEWHPDSYVGYRSDYFHMAISVKSTSSKGNASNSIRLTPLTFMYFFYWWNTITEAISLPVRQGNLFTQLPADKNSHSKTSTHLFTVKYQIVLEPLNLSHTILHSSGEKNKNIAFSGLKGKVGRFVLDLHQRKELLTYVNRKLDIENQILHLKMNQGEISFENADVRLVNAIFADRSMRSQLDKYLTGADTTDSSSGDSYGNGNNTSGYLKWLNNVDIQGGDFSWFDPEDFTELEMREVLSPYPKVTIIPFFFTPQFSYVREFSLQEDGPYPFGYEASHNCELGKTKPEHIQDGLLKSRLDVLKRDIKEQKLLLKSLNETDGLDGSIKFQKVKVRASLKVLEEKLEVLDAIYEATTGLSGSESEREDSSEMISRLESRKLMLSAFSSHRSLDETRKQGLLHKEVSEFHNRFIVHNLQIKWSNNVRNLFMGYMLVVSEAKSHSYFMSKKAVDLVESVINTLPEELQTDFSLDGGFCTETKQDAEIVNDFDDYLDEVDSETQEADHKFLVKLINPQIQLISDKDPHSVVLLVSKDLEMRTISVNLKGISKLINADEEIDGLVETRYGGLFNDSSIYVFKREDVTISHPNVPYGYVDGKLAVSWPPWVETEAIYDETWTKDYLVCERTIMALTFKKPNDLYMDTTSITAKNEIKAHLGKIVVRADSDQYSSLYYMITDLLLHGKNEKDSLKNRLEKIIALSDNDDFYGLDKRVLTLQTSIRELHDLLLKVDNKVMKLNQLERTQVHYVELELEKKKMELSMIMKGLKLRNTKSSNKRAARSWLISSDQIIWHVLTPDRKPLIDLALANSKFYRVDSVDGSNNNKVEVGIIQGFNLQESSVYPELLSPLNENKNNKDPVIHMSWKMLNPVGGIPIMQQAKLKVQPLKIQLDYATAKVLFDYAFPKDDSASTQKSSKPTRSSKESPAKLSLHKQSYESKDGSGINDELDGDVSFGDLAIERKNIFKHWRRSTPSSLSSAYEEAESSSISSKKTGSFSSRFSSSEDLTSPVSEPSTEPKTNGLKIGKKKNKTEDTDDIALILTRSSKYLSVVDIEIEAFKLIISFKAPKHLNIIDVHNLLLNIPNIRYQNKTWSGEDFILHLRKDITKIILQHTGQIIGNKFKVRKRSSLKEPLKQLSNYASFVTVLDLQHASEPVPHHFGQRQNGLNGHHQHHHHHSRHSPSERYPDGDVTLKVPQHQATTSFEHLLQEIINEEDEQDLSSDNT